MPLPFLVDAHEDIAYNILNFGRDYTRAAVDTRRHEAETGSIAPQHTGDTLLGWLDYQRGRTAVVFGTLFVTPIRRSLGDWENQRYRDFEEAHRLYSAQLDVYHKMADQHPDKFRLVGSRADMEAVLSHWADASAESHPMGLVPLMEGAEGVRTPSELEEWWERGVRVIGPAWAGTRFCGGTRDPGPLTDEGRELLDAMAGVGFTLDISHMDPLSALQSLDRYEGPVIASHANAAVLLPGYDGNRLLPDTVIRRLLERGGTIGVVPYNKFLNLEWKHGDRREDVPLDAVAAQIDYICQMAGDALHAGLGSDFDGGFGLDSVPAGIDTVADLQKLGPLLAAKGYNQDAVAAVLGGNWLRHLEMNLPA